MTCPTGRNTAPLKQSPATAFVKALQDGRLILQTVEGSNQQLFYPRLAGPGSGTENLQWEEASGEGRVYATTVVRPRPPAQPYNVALIDLKEGPRIMSRVEGIAPDAVTINMPVRATIRQEEDGPLLLFLPIGNPE